jgi:hypothetical protein
MDMKEQAEHVQKIIDGIATNAIALSPDARPAFIKAEIAKVRRSFLQTYEADPRLVSAAMGFLDTMYGAVKAQARFLQEKGDGSRIW